MLDGFPNRSPKNGATPRNLMMNRVVRRAMVEIYLPHCLGPPEPSVLPFRTGPSSDKESSTRASAPRSRPIPWCGTGDKLHCLPVFLQPTAAFRLRRPMNSPTVITKGLERMKPPPGPRTLFTMFFLRSRETAALVHSGMSPAGDELGSWTGLPREMRCQRHTPHGYLPPL
jgi:hypothetical protein